MVEDKKMSKSASVFYKPPKVKIGMKNENPSGIKGRTGSPMNLVRKK